MMNTGFNFLWNSHKNKDVVIQKCQVRALGKPNGILNVLRKSSVCVSEMEE